MAPKLTSEEREQIVSYLKDGKSQNWTAKKVKRSPGTVGNVARAEGIPALDIQTPKKANEARSAFAEERRLTIIGKGFDKADELLSRIKDAGEFQKWTVGLGTLVDKARLEMGEATSRNESHSYDHSEDLEGYFAELDTFRAEDGEADTGEPLDTAEAYGQTA